MPVIERECTILPVKKNDGDQTDGYYHLITTSKPQVPVKSIDDLTFISGQFFFPLLQLLRRYSFPIGYFTHYF